MVLASVAQKVRRSEHDLRGISVPKAVAAGPRRLDGGVGLTGAEWRRDYSQ
jgi:hypothetical protein